MRRDVLEMAAMGATTREIGVELNVSESWVRRVKQEYRESGKTAPKRTRQRAKAYESHADWLRETIRQTPDIYLRELQELATQERDGTVSLQTLCRALRALGITRKKRR